MEPLNVNTVIGHISNRLGGAPEALILVGCVMEAVAYGRKIVRVAVKWDTALMHSIYQVVQLFRRDGVPGFFHCLP